MAPLLSFAIWLPRAPKTAPRAPQEAPKRAQKGPKRAPGGPQEGPRGPKEGLNWVPRGPPNIAHDPTTRHTIYREGRAIVRSSIQIFTTSKVNLLNPRGLRTDSRLPRKRAPHCARGSRMEGVRALQDGRAIHERTSNAEAKSPTQLHPQQVPRDRCPVSGHVSPRVLRRNIPCQHYINNASNNHKYNSTVTSHNSLLT